MGKSTMATLMYQGGALHVTDDVGRVFFEWITWGSPRVDPRADSESPRSTSQTSCQARAGDEPATTALRSLYPIGSRNGTPLTRW